MTNTPRLQEAARFMRERHNIYLKRKAGWPGPWTEDPILRDGRFCNIFRELDTVTQWINANIRVPFADHKSLWLMLAIARYVNWPPTLQWLFDLDAMPDRENWHPSLLTSGLEQWAAKGEKVYTGAYMIRAESDPAKEWYSWTKHRYIAEIVIGRLWEDRDDWAKTLEPDSDYAQDHTTLESVWREFQQPRYVGWGPFMAYEVVTDLRHTRYLRDAADIMTWANAGPGAIRGLNRLYGRPLKEHPRPEVTNEEMQRMMEELNASAQLWPAKWPRLEMRDVEHTLCEFDKYERVRLGEGKMRSKYDWRRGTAL